MGGLSVSHWAIVLLVVFVLFGRGRISDVMGDFGKGLSSFRKGLTDGDEVDTTSLSHLSSGSSPVSPESASVKIKPE